MSAATDPGPPLPSAAPAGTGNPAVFPAFCAAGLWPGLGPGLAARLAEAGITGPEQVEPGKLAQLPGVGAKRAGRLTAAFEAVMPSYRVAELLVPCRVPARFAGAAVSRLGPAAAQLLREDPWRLLAVPPIRPDQADWFARQLLGDGAHPQDPRRGRALAGYLLAQAARDGHTAVPAEAVMTSLRRFRIADPAAAIAAALDEGIVLPLPPAAADGEEDPDGDGPDGDGPDGDGPDGDGPDGALLLGLPRYAMAEDAVAEGLQRLLALAEPFPAGSGDGTAGPDSAEAAGPDSAEAAEPDSAEAGELGGPAAGELDETQQAAVRAVAEHGVCVLSGGPGTGKSRTVAAVVALAAAAGLRVALAAPTGRAAKRLEELTGAPAVTLHRLLGAQGRGGRAGRDGDQAGDGGPAGGRPQRRGGLGLHPE